MFPFLLSVYMCVCGRGGVEGRMGNGEWCFSIAALPGYLYVYFMLATKFVPFGMFLFVLFSGDEKVNPVLSTFQCSKSTRVSERTNNLRG